VSEARHGDRAPAGGGWLLALDTATNTIVVAAGTPTGRLLSTESLGGRHRHSQELLPAIARLVERSNLHLADLAGIVVGTGPGAFTGLRVGLATAKTLAHELGVPVTGVGTADAILLDEGEGTVLWLPSGPRERLAVRRGEAPQVIAGDDVPGASSAGVAIDLEGRAPDEALARGRRAVERLPERLLRLGGARLAAGEVDDPERLVPRYAAPPRGATETEPAGGVAWSRDPR
jgi:tRNA threonylcarbamoyl adenosine modification protein YeaZ